MNMMTGAVAINGGVGVMEIHQPQVAVSQMAASVAQAAEQVALNAHITLRELKGMIDTVVEKKLPTLNRIESWIEAIFAYVSSEAINHGVAWDGYKVVEGRSKRQFLDTKSVVAAAEKAGYTDIYKTELISLTEFEKLMGKKKFKEILGEYVVKPPGKLALVPNSDPREAVDLETAEDEFTPLD